jgi:hypothetical protein
VSRQAPKRLPGAGTPKAIIESSRERNSRRALLREIEDSNRIVTGPLTLDLRAERSGTGTGRVYTIEVETTDAAGNTTRQTVCQRSAEP